MSIGALAAAVLSVGASALAKKAVGAAVKEAYAALKTALTRWAAREVERLEADPDSEARAEVLAVTVDELADDKGKAEIKTLAEALKAELSKAGLGATVENRVCVIADHGGFAAGRDLRIEDLVGDFIRFERLESTERQDTAEGAERQWERWQEEDARGTRRLVDQQVARLEAAIRRIKEVEAQRTQPRPAPYQKDAQRTRVSFAWPRLLSKGRSSIFVFHVYPEKLAEKAEGQIQSLLSTRNLTEKKAESAHIVGERISVAPKCPVVMFMPEEQTLRIENLLSKLSFTGIPKDGCQAGEHAGLVLIKDAETGDSRESLDFTIQVVDYAFDHVSRPWISFVSSAALALVSAASFTLTFLQQIDTTFGLTAGTGAASLIAIILSWGILPFSRTRTVGSTISI